MQHGRGWFESQCQGVVVDSRREVIAPGVGQSAQPEKVGRLLSRAEKCVAGVDRFPIALQFQQCTHPVALGVGILGIDRKRKIRGAECLLKLLVREEHSPTLGVVFHQFWTPGDTQTDGLVEIGQSDCATCGVT